MRGYCPIVLLLLTVLTGCSSSSDADNDGDGIRDRSDNCPTEYNPDQTASIGNITLLGDACDDEDDDAVADAIDNCPLMSNTDQADTDGNGLGDVCESCTALSLVADTRPGMDDSRVRPFVALGDNLFFMVEYDELWVHDASAGTTQLAALSPGLIVGGSHSSTVLDGIWYFSAYDEEHNYELWMYDAVAGARLAAEIVPGSNGSHPYYLTALDVFC